MRTVCVKRLPMAVQPRTPPGVLELLPAQQIAFQRMLDTIRRGFERFGFLPVETPAFELTDVLLTKSGGETEKQVYFVQSTGALDQADGKRPELALHFDLTVPLARYVAEHEHELAFPFRRYQIQRVYRGERAQRGRFREFYQCDIDVIGKDALAISYDAELPAVVHGIFTALKIGAFTIKINNRKLLRGILESLDVMPAVQPAVLHEIDRLGKHDRAAVESRVGAIIGTPSASRLLELIGAPGGATEILARLQRFESRSPSYAEGVAELARVHADTLALGVPSAMLAIDLSIVRGLDYYTGTVYETFLDAHPGIGSICSGGRYDDLAGHYTRSKLPGVGISIGATRLFSQLLELGLVAAGPRATADVIVLRVDDDLGGDCAAVAAELRGHGWNVEVYGTADKLGKQLKYADRVGVPIAVIVGKREFAAGVVRLKDLRVTDMAARNESEVPRGHLIDALADLID